jgi:hypothetical protein
MDLNEFGTTLLQHLDRIATAMEDLAGAGTLPSAKETPKVPRTPEPLTADEQAAIAPAEPVTPVTPAQAAPSAPPPPAIPAPAAPTEPAAAPAPTPAAAAPAPVEPPAPANAGPETPAIGEKHEKLRSVINKAAEKHGLAYGKSILTNCAYATVTDVPPDQLDAVIQYAEQMLAQPAAGG